ncbi:MAG: TIR domain-containing protein [bacterium]|nr:TIR domain-containing protein [bacterium]
MIFLSYAQGEDIGQVYGFKAMLKSVNTRVLFVKDSCKRDYTDRPGEELENHIRSLIDQCSVTVCLISGKTQDNEWVQKELEISRSMNKGIAGIILNAGKDEIPEQFYPDIFRNSDYKVHDWDRPEIMEHWIREAEMLN